MMLPPYLIPPLDNRIDKNNNKVNSDKRNSPANKLIHQIKVERYKKWREEELKKQMHKKQL